MSKSKLQKLKFHIAGFEGCPYFEGAVATLKNFKKDNHGKTYEIVLSIKKIHRDKWSKHLEKQCEIVLEKHKPHALNHKTSPFIHCNNHFIGGFDKLNIELNKTTPFSKMCN